MVQCRKSESPIEEHAKYLAHAKYFMSNLASKSQIALRVGTIENEILRCL